MKARALTEYASGLAGFGHVPADTCVVWDDGRDLTHVMASINATTGDLLLARELGCDGYLLHHPLAGAARRDFHCVLERMVDLVAQHGVARERASEAVAPLRRRVRFNDHASDWDHLASAAEHIGLSLLNIHLPADELGRMVMVEALEGLEAEATLGDVEARLRSIPELRHPANEILLLPGDPGRRAGRVAVMHAGGTNGGAAVAECLMDDASPPVGTVVYIHIGGEDAAKIEARAARGGSGSVIVTGHLASDAIGMNALMRVMRDKGMTVTPHGGLKAFS